MLDANGTKLELGDVVAYAVQPGELRLGVIKETEGDWRCTIQPKAKYSKRTTRSPREVAKLC